MSELLEPLKPFDVHNRLLRSNVSPEQWVNPDPKSAYHLVVIGAGTAGLVTAAGAAGLGARVALVERELMGGDCLNVGCVPSKGVIAAARAVAALRTGKDFGVDEPDNVDFDFGIAMARMREKRAQISPVDSAERFTSLGVDVFFGTASFMDESTIRVVAGDGACSNLQFRKAVVAAGARAWNPPITGLESVRALTNETLFSLTELPPRFGVVGAGPIGCEMAQSFARLGSEVFLFERADHILSREDHDAAKFVQNSLKRDRVNLVLNAKEMELAKSSDGNIVVTVQQLGKPKSIVVDELLIAVGRAPNTDGLNLEQVGVEFDRRGIKVNDYMQTTNPKIFAAGDICSKLQFTHAADFQARAVIQNALFAIGPFGRKKASSLIIPWATYTSPEIAHVGMYARDAHDSGIEIDTYVQSFEDIDRAILENKEDGFVKVHTRKGSDQIVGATIVAENAGDLISEICLAMTNKIGLSGIGATIHPYPTQAEAIRKLGDQYNKTKLTPLSAKILKFLMRINVGS